MTFLASVSTFLACGLSLLLAQALFTALTSPLRSLPGPLISRFTNVRLKRAVTSGKRIFYIDDLHKQYGPVVRISPREVAVSDVDGFKMIHNVSSKYEKDVWYEKLTNFPRRSVFTMRTAKTHAARRRIFARSFSKSFLRDNWEWAVRQNAELAVSQIKERAEQGSVDAFRWYTFLATDIIGVLGFGESFGLLESGKVTEYIRVLHKALVGNGIGAELPLLRSILARVPYKPIEEAFNSSHYILEYAQKAVENARKKSGKTNLMATVLEEGQKDNGALDDVDVQVEATSLIFAGGGTTANTMCYLTWAVLSRPALQAALEEEVAGLDADFRDADLEELPLLNAILSETMRLYCAVPGSLPRVVPAGGATISGFYIPEGTTVSTQAYTMHRKEDLWDHPLVFDPARFLADKDITPAAKATSCGFGAGAYTCLGQHLANMEIRYTVANLFRQCRGLHLAPSMTKEMMDFENFFVITPKGHRLDVTMTMPPKGQTLRSF